MSALIGNFIHSFRQALKHLFPQSRNSFLVDRGPYGLPIPVTPHRTVEEKELAGRRLLIVGDVHGCYDELVELLDTCGARDPNICIAFVGDLTNKGPKSSEVIKLVHQLGAYCVRGNHDEVSLRTWQLYTEGERSLPTKFQWLRNLSKQEIQWYQGLPYSIRFPSREVLLVHAGLIPEVPLNQQSYDDLLHLKEVTFDTKTVTFSGCSSSPPPPNSQPWSQAWPGPDHIYFGHDARRFLQVHPFAIGVDTGCVYGGHLTAVFDDDRQKFIQVKARKIYDKGKKPPNIK